MGISITLTGLHEVFVAKKQGKRSANAMYLLLLLHFASFSYHFTCFLLPTAFKCHCLPFC